MAEIALGRNPLDCLNLTLTEIVASFQYREIRDVVHVPIISAINGGTEPLAPGTRVRFNLETGEAFPDAEAPLGIVDPFLEHPPLPGEYFWLCVFPGRTKSLTRRWEHHSLDCGEREKKSDTPVPAVRA